MEWSLTYDARPWSVNSERAGGTKRGIGGHYGRAAKAKEWRTAFHWLAVQAKIPPLKTATVDVYQECRDKRRPDPGSIYPAFKSALDGIVDAGVLKDDGPDFIERVSFYPATVGKGDSLTIVLTSQVKEDQ